LTSSVRISASEQNAADEVEVSTNQQFKLNPS
jgi:hypothetical protein